MVWEGISHAVKSPLIVVPGNLTAVRYRDEILRPVAAPFVQPHQMTFQHDNARPHVARVCQDFLANNNSLPLDWPPYSPDLSPIDLFHIACAHAYIGHVARYFSIIGETLQRWGKGILSH